MQYKNYGIEDFAKDPFFQQWVLAPDADTDRFWAEWLAKNPHQRLIIEEAKSTILLLGLTRDTHANANFLSGWKKLDRIWDHHMAQEIGTRRPMLKNIGWKAAATLLILMVSAVTIWYIQNRKVTVRTRFTEMRSVHLPDGTIVDLNGNSSISYLPEWRSRNTREVWLRGEAFFSVTHDADRKFTVHASGGIDISVLGTTFNVRNRGNATKVSLKTGKIQIHLSEDYLPGAGKTADKGFVMKPGEVAEFDAAAHRITRSEGNVSDFDIWKAKKLVFDNTAMKDVATILEETYGLKVVVDKSLEMRRITGEFASDDLDILLQFIARALDAHVTRKADEILFKRN